MTELRLLSLGTASPYSRTAVLSLCFTAVLSCGCALTRTVGKIIPGGGSHVETNAAPAAEAPGAKVPETGYREVTRYREVEKQIEATCEGQRWVAGEIDPIKYHKMAVYPLEVIDFNSDLALYWSEVIEEWLMSTKRFSVITRPQLASVLKPHNLGQGERMDLEALRVLRRVFGVQAIVHGTVNGARGGPNWKLQLFDSKDATLLWNAEGSGDLSAEVPKVLSSCFGHPETYTYPCTKTVTERVPYMAREKYVVYKEKD